MRKRTKRVVLALSAIVVIVAALALASILFPAEPIAVTHT